MPRNPTLVTASRDRSQIGRHSWGRNLLGPCVGLRIPPVGRPHGPWPVPIALVVMLADALEGVARPPVGARPARIGVRQLGASSLFVVIVLLGYLA